MSRRAAESDAVETPAKPPPKRAPTSPAKRRPAARTKSKPAPAQPVRVETRPALLVARVAAIAIAAAGGIFLLVGGDPRPAAAERATSVTGVTSTDELRAFARSSETDVYWAGRVGSRRLHLSPTPTGTFVRYLPVGARATRGPSLTVATYPLADAYPTAIRRSRGEGVASRRLAGAGIAVWNVGQPTSVYLAWRGTPSLVEVYAPTGAEARTVALSGRVRPVR